MMVSPRASVLRQPDSCSATGFMYSMRPSRSVVMTASPIDCSVTWARSFSVEHRLLGALALGDVGDRALIGHDALLLVAHHPRALEHHQLRAVAAAQYRFGVVDLAVRCSSCTNSARSAGFQHSEAAPRSA